MPKWKVHLTTGIIATVVLVYAGILSGYGHYFINNGSIDYFFCFQIAFITPLGAMIADFDYRKTRIRYSLGPALGGFMLISYLYLNRSDLSGIDPSFLVVIAVLFLLLPLVAGLVVPFKHHGRLHSLTAAALYALSWFAVELFILQLSTTQAALVGAFGFIAYCTHLLLDLDLKLL